MYHSMPKLRGGQVGNGPIREYGSKKPDSRDRSGIYWCVVLNVWTLYTPPQDMYSLLII